MAAFDCAWTTAKSELEREREKRGLEREHGAELCSKKKTPQLFEFFFLIYSRPEEWTKQAMRMTGTSNFFRIYFPSFAETAKKTDWTFLRMSSYFQHPSLHRFCCQTLYKTDFYRLVMQAL